MKSLADAVMQIESAGDWRAERFEPAVYGRSLTSDQLKIRQAIKAIHRCSDATATVIYATSYGWFQLMGFNLWGRIGIRCHKADFIQNQALQRRAFEQYARDAGIWFEPASCADEVELHTRCQLFALRYNGPGNVDDYAGRLKAALTGPDLPHLPQSAPELAPASPQPETKP